MRKSRFSVEQIAAVLRQAESGMAVDDLIRQLGISQQTFYRWKKAYGGLQPDQVRELKQQIADQNGENKRLLERNEILEAEVVELKKGMETVEERARHELGMVKDGETLY